jgi:lipopolysaccharide heptosyltransferase I
MVASLLLVRLSSIGDVVHGLPALELARAALPSARIGWAVESEAAPLLRDHPALDALHVLDRRALGRDRGRPRALGRARAFVREVRAARYEAAIDLQGLARSALVARIATRRTLGPAHARELATLAYAHRLRVPAPGEAHAVVRSLELVRRALEVLGGDAPRETPGARLVLSTEARERAFAALAPLEGAPFVALLPGAGKPANRPPLELLAATARAVLARWPEARFAVLGGAADRERGRELSGRVSALDLSGKLALDETAAILERAAVVLGGDTGPLHVARALSVPVVSLFFAADPQRTGPLGLSGRAPAIVVRGGAPCAPCLARRCLRDDRVRICLEPLGPQRIARAVLEAAVREAASA